MKARDFVHSQMTRNDKSEIHCLQHFEDFLSKFPHLSIKYKYNCTIIQSRKSLLWNQPRKIMGSTFPPQSSSMSISSSFFAVFYNALFKGIGTLKITFAASLIPTNMGPSLSWWARALEMQLLASSFLSPKSARNSAKTSKCKVRTRRMSRAKRATWKMMSHIPCGGCWWLSPFHPSEKYALVQWVIISPRK